MARARSATEKRTFPKDSIAKARVGSSQVHEVEIEQDGGLFAGGVHEIGPLGGRGFVLEGEVDVGVGAGVTARARPEEPYPPQFESRLRLPQQFAQGRRTRESVRCGSIAPTCRGLDHAAKVPPVRRQRERKKREQSMEAG